MKCPAELFFCLTLLNVFDTFMQSYLCWYHEASTALCDLLMLSVQMKACSTLLTFDWTSYKFFLHFKIGMENLKEKNCHKFASYWIVFYFIFTKNAFNAFTSHECREMSNKNKQHQSGTFKIFSRWIQRFCSSANLNTFKQKVTEMRVFLFKI